MLATTPRDLTPEEKERPYAKLFYRELPEISERHKRVLERGEFMDPEYAMIPEHPLDRLGDIPEEAECGYCYLPEGGAYVCSRTDMPGITVDMYRHWNYWWNEENPEESQMRYKCWCPKDHHNSGFMWSSENIGPYLIEIILSESIRDMPEKIGLTAQNLKDAGVLMQDGVNLQQKYVNEDLEQQPIPSIVCHMLYDAPDGLIMRSRFWLGYQAIGGRMVNISGKKKLVDEDFLRGLMAHNSIEMQGLVQIMPILWNEFKE